MQTALEQAPICPECGLPPDRHTELIPVERPIVARDTGVLTIEGLISEKRYELPEDPQLLSSNGHAFSIPADARSPSPSHVTREPIGDQPRVTSPEYAHAD